MFVFDLDFRRVQERSQDVFLAPRRGPRRPLGSGSGPRAAFLEGPGSAKVRQGSTFEGHTGRILTFSVLWSLAGQAIADGHVKRIISTGETVLGNKIVYPVGEAKITAFEFTVPVGAPVAPHTHSFPVLLIISKEFLI